MSVSKEELLRLAKKAWPLPDEYGGHDDMAVSMTGPTVRVYHPYEDDAGGFFVIHPSLAKEAAHAALLVLAGEDDRERLRAENAALREQLAARETVQAMTREAAYEIVERELRAITGFDGIRFMRLNVHPWTVRAFEKDKSSAPKLLEAVDALKGGKMAEVTREHREAAFQTTFLRPSEDGDRARGWVNTGEYGHGTRAEWRQLDFLAQAIAEAEARGRAAERADAVTFVRNCSKEVLRVIGVSKRMPTASIVDALEELAESLENGEHAGAAGKSGG